MSRISYAKEYKKLTTSKETLVARLVPTVKELFNPPLREHADGFDLRLKDGGWVSCSFNKEQEREVAHDEYAVLVHGEYYEMKLRLWNKGLEDIVCKAKLDSLDRDSLVRSLKGLIKDAQEKLKKVQGHLNALNETLGS